MISGINAISIYDPLTGTVVQLNSIGEDGTSEIKKPLFDRNSKGNEIFAGHESNFEFTAYDTAGFDQLETWMKNKTYVHMVTNGIEEHILWYENSLITVTKNFGFKVGGRNSFTVKLNKKGGIHNIQVGSNLLYLAAGWKDTGADNLADGYSMSTSSATVTKLFANSLQRLTVTAPGSLIVPVSFVYPIAGVKLTAFANLGAANNFVYNSLLQQLSFANASLQETNIQNDSIGSVTTLANIYTIKFNLISNANAANASIVEQNCPYLGSKFSTKKVVLY